MLDRSMIIHETKIARFGDIINDVISSATQLESKGSNVSQLELDRLATKIAEATPDLNGWYNDISKVDKIFYFKNTCLKGAPDRVPAPLAVVTLLKLIQQIQPYTQVCMIASADRDMFYYSQQIINEGLI